jgi:hypothetical protein
MKTLERGTRLTELKAKLVGRAGQLVRGVHITKDDPITHLFNILKQEYGDRACVIRAQRKKLRELPPPKQTYESLRDFILGLQEGVSCLENLGVDIEDQDDLLYKLVGKLTPHQGQSFFEKFPDD